MSDVLDFKPMLFNAKMLQASKAGKKTVTRRPVKYKSRDGSIPVPTEAEYTGVKVGLHTWETDRYMFSVPSPYLPGDICYIPEPWKALCSWQKGPLTAPKYGYAVKFPDGEEKEFFFATSDRAKKWEKYLDKPRENWQSPYFMPKEAARLFLRVTDIHVERLQDITEEQATSEGASAGSLQVTGGPWGVEDDPDVWSAVDAFSAIWDSTVKPNDRDLYGWAADPWAWVISFERISKEEAEI